jgi:hypothetical protein
VTDGKEVRSGDETREWVDEEIRKLVRMYLAGSTSPVICTATRCGRGWTESLSRLVSAVGTQSEGALPWDAPSQPPTGQGARL